ncbi:DNA-directed RNA polymerase subunit [Fusarium keratoplasticum]|uniref:DNA-directed RNA polymerase subunit n=14 Tax=Fusarium solani species complex TaxID=232080 RepID=A0ACC0RI69_9HYPO|nr:DNA-directed RNA polymerase II subunit RPB1 [Fusarium keratoplasticum]KAI8684674.1 DNA-directed RNA polymerase subunit [Fusarium keratoplasticum]KAI8688785.1 DNA-directed RNA polymerase subunit [Fusarium keratoplasticum]
MANLIFTHSSAPLKTVEEIQFGLMSPEEIKNMSVCHILYPETMEENKTKPRDGGLNDPLLGSIDRQFRCKTCTQAMGECPGHFGHIELAKPVYHPGFIKKVKKILEIVCHNCSKVLADTRDPEFAAAIATRDPKVRFSRVWEVCKKKRRCDNDEPKQKDEEFAPGMKMGPVEGHGGCGNVQPNVRQAALQLKAAFDVVEEGGGKRRETTPITPEMAHNILRRITEEDLRDMGLNSDYARPEWMVLTVLPVPPPPVRPSISMDGTGTGMRNEDDLTYKLGDIIRANGNVKQAIREGSPAHIARDFEELLQYHVATYMDNDIAGQPRALQKSGRPVKAIRARLKGKEGRLRGNLMGKRVDFSARTVITGDANLSLHEVGVPRSIARTLTYPETVTPYNIGRLHQYVENGPNEHPGAKYVIRADGQRIDLRHHRRAGAISLEYGWKVERHLIDGDYIIFNRQPSLHKESMMGHRVRVMPYSTFRLNLSVTSPYNADFDGDEMNLHVPQSEETRAEVKELCLVPLNIVSPQKNGPLMGIVQDSLAGVYKLCRRDTFLTKEQIMNSMLWVPNWDGVIPQPAILKPRPRWTGKQLISMVIPKEVTLHNGNDKKEDAPLKDEGILIQAGQLMYGLPTKKIVGAAAGGIVHISYNELGAEGAMAFLNGVQQVVTYWLLNNGHSIGIGDTIPDKATIEKVQVHIDEEKAEVARLTAMATANELEALPGMNVRATFENKVSMALNQARDKAGTTTQKSLKDSNNAVTMASSGSKGSSINISQMTALVGQQIVEGKRIPFGFKYRTLPHFTKDDYSPEARGFVENSYLRGLTPSEFFFHAMAGREGLIDTAVKTAETGYIQRRLVKALEDLSARYDGTVRNSLGDVVQFLYGEDGLDAMCIEKQKLGILNMSNAAFKAKYRLDLANPPEWFKQDYEFGNELTGDRPSMALLDTEWEALLKDRRVIRQINKAKMNEEMMQLPLNITRIIESAKRVFNVKANDRSNLRPSDVIPAVQNMLDHMKIVRGTDPISQEADANASILFKGLLRSRLAFKEVVKEHRLNKLAFDHVIGELQNRWDRAFVSPGEMVGVLAAQSIGEPATQMTLNTFHFAGVSSKNVTLGVPRLKEILNLAKNIKTPSMAVYLNTPLARQEQAKKLRSMVEYTNLRSVTAVTEIYYDPDIQSTNIPEDMDMVESYFMIPDDTQVSIDQQSRWLLRITLDRQKLLDKEIRIDDVAQRIKEEYPTDLAVIFSDNNADEQVIRIRTVSAGDKDEDGDGRMEDDVMLKRLEAHLLDTLTLRGVNGVERAFLTKGTRLVESPDGALLAIKDDPRCTQWYLDTSGSALRDVLAVDGVDATRTYTNDLWQVVEVFGIEAARSALVKELTNVLAFDGSYVNHRHIALLTDVMTYRGSISAVTRHGINRADTGALMRCSFEETVEILLEAAASGELDDCRGISENVMLGQMAPMGTGNFDVLLDPKMLETVISDNSRMGLMPGMPVKGGESEGAATPYDTGSPMADSGYLSLSSPAAGNFSPIQGAGSDTPAGFGNTEYGFGGSTAMSPYAMRGGTSPFTTSPTSPFGPGGGYSPTSPNAYSPTSPLVDGGMGRYATSPSFSPSSPSFSPTSPMVRPTSPASPNYSPSSPNYSPASPSSPRHYSPTSPAQFNSPTSPNYSPASPNYSPASPNLHAGGTTSPSYSPASPTWSPTSPEAYSPTSPYQRSPGAQQSPTSPSYSPTSPAFSPRTPGPGSSGNQYSPNSPSNE